VAFFGYLALGSIAGSLAWVSRGRHEPSLLISALLVGAAGAVLGGELAYASGMGDLDRSLSAETAIVASASAFVALLLFDAIKEQDKLEHR